MTEKIGGGRMEPEDKRRAYNITSEAVSDILTECGNFGDFVWCKEFGCEYLQACKEISGDVYKPGKVSRGDEFSA